MANERDLIGIIGPELELMGVECVKLEVVGSARSPVVRLYIDRPGGVTISDCASVSRAIGLVLEREDPFPGRYLLEVSSPGNNRPLVTEEHYQRFAGSEARVAVEREGEERITYTGRIRSCISGNLTLDTDGGDVVVALRDVVRANLINQEYKIDKKRKKDPRPSRRLRRRGEN
ncbi:MAG TPA: ribosome maturation factor RimP [Candidatus Krumholzibacteria bacterium]|nr:ribosome maturation factor RimP [Candidatus Krumholzibacteria bacterium]